MVELEYRVGGLKINPKALYFAGFDSYDAEHLFVIGVNDNAVSIYVAEAERHASVPQKFSLSDYIVGGGSCYTNHQKELVLDDYSGNYGAIPKNVAQKFGELMLPELKKLGIEINGIIAEPVEKKINDFWK